MTPRWLSILALLLSSAGTLPAAELELVEHVSESYTIRSDLPEKQVRVFADHMDAVFAEYQKRFADFPSRDGGAMTLHLFRRKAGFESHMAGHKIDARNSGGMFFVRRSGRGLAAYTEGKSRAEVFATLQHEGFHQFAFTHIGTDLPVWINEGLAQYFEDGILVNGRFTLGQANARRIASVKAAIDAGRTLDFDELLALDEPSWQQAVIAGGPRAGLMYDQAWSLTYFLITAEGGRYRDFFERYLRLVAAGKPSADAFREAFKAQETKAFRERWEAWAGTVEPDEFHTALQRMRFLAAGLRFLHDKGQKPPAGLDELRRRLQAVKFHVIATVDGVSAQYHATDENLFRFTTSGGGESPFELLEPEGLGLPPRITAPGLRPEPTWVWSRDESGDLADDLTFR